MSQRRRNWPRVHAHRALDWFPSVGAESSTIHPAVNAKCSANRQVKNPGIHLAAGRCASVHGSVKIRDLSSSRETFSVSHVEAKTVFELLASGRRRTLTISVNRLKNFECGRDRINRKRRMEDTVSRCPTKGHSVQRPSSDANASTYRQSPLHHSPGLSSFLIDDILGARANSASADAEQRRRRQQRDWNVAELTVRSASSSSGNRTPLHRPRPLSSGADVDGCWMATGQPASDFNSADDGVTSSTGYSTPTHPSNGSLSRLGLGGHFHAQTAHDMFRLAGLSTVHCLHEGLANALYSKGKGSRP